MNNIITLPFHTTKDREQAADFVSRLNQSASFSATTVEGELVIKLA